MYEAVINDILSQLENGMTKAMQEMEKRLITFHQKIITANVYNAYTPQNGYIRRKNNGGLRDRTNFHTTINGGGKEYELTLQNETQGTNARRLDEIICEASGFHWMNVPKRDFIGATAQGFEKEATEVLRDALKKAGFIIEC